MATNNHQKLSVIFLMSTFSGLLLSYFVAPYYGIEGVGGVLFLCEFPVFYYAISRALSVLGDKWLGYTANLFRIDLKTFRGV
jgi:hypothetical protein